MSLFRCGGMRVQGPGSAGGVACAGGAAASGGSGTRRTRSRLQGGRSRLAGSTGSGDVQDDFRGIGARGVHVGEGGNRIVKVAHLNPFQRSQAPG